MLDHSLKTVSKDLALDKQAALFIKLQSIQDMPYARRKSQRETHGQPHTELVDRLFLAKIFIAEGENRGA